MRNKIIHSLLILFILFLAGSGITMLYLYKTTTNLQSVINLHRVEIIRQDLVIRAQSVQSQLYSFGTAFGSELDVIVENVIDLDESANKCLQCHHNEKITRRLESVVELVEQYQDALSYLITTSANEERIERLKTVAIGTGNNLLSQVQEMAFIAGQKLNDKTFTSLNEINNSKIILIITLILSFFIAIAIAVSMTRQVTEPIYELLTATRRIQSGEFGYTTNYRAKGEFGELINSFNEMSQSLDESNRKVMHHLNSLSNLYSVTLTFHSTTNATDIYREVAFGVAEIVDAQQCGLMLLEDTRFVHMYPAVGLDRDAVRSISIPKADLLELYVPSNRRAFIMNRNDGSSPFPDIDFPLGVKNILLVWIRQKGELVGAIRVANKTGNDFTEEDVRPLAILANNISVALENAALYDDLRRQMQEIQDAQQQLVQAAKLVAIGELASNVAHELNNPLTTVLGYTELIKEEENIDDILKDLDVIEKESLRAREIVRQLLEFSRRRDLRVRELDLNKILTDVIDLIFIQKRHANINRELDLKEIPLIHGDENQLKQVFVNIINNAIFAMGSKGSLKISTFYEEGHVYAKISDTGAGIPKEHLPRIFEPFFSTKKEKGTGIGLSVSYKIIQGHNGNIEVASEEGKGTTFTIILPEKGKDHMSEKADPETKAENRPSGSA
jgi:signal transduction histidine kinase/HAMP domain-containing protein